MIYCEVGPFMEGLVVWKEALEAVYRAVTDGRFLGFVVGLIIVMSVILVVSATAMVIIERILEDRKKRSQSEDRNNTSTLRK